ncbi:MAG TPA: hypothetical protein VN645_03810 [Steroidobacteraceae bacterium]|nr:hypothetical protein [Steroidobacteraceae bacterium]
MNRLGKWLAAVANAFGVPGFVREGDYVSEDARITVRVRRGTSFTVISVNNVDIYFERFSGRIDGISLSQRPKRKPVAAGKSGRSGGSP